MDTIRQYLTQVRGFNTIGANYYSYLANWDEWYRGCVDKFHRYNQYNGTSYVAKKLYSLGMSKKICEDHANLMMNEKVQISTGNDTFDSTLTDILNYNNFYVRANQLVELAFALGTGAFVEYQDAAKKSIIDYVRAPMIYPLTWDNGDITECAFGSVRIIKGDEYYYINIHRLDEQGNYVTENKLVKSNNSSAPSEMEMEGVIPEVKTGSPLPRFQIIMPNIINNIDYDCPMGISVFANAIDELKGVDVAYDSYVNEFILGKKRIIVPMSMIRTVIDSADSVYKPVFDPNDVTFYAFPDDTATEIKEINMELRSEPHEAGLQRFLSLLGDKCGLGADRYKFERGSAMTATEVLNKESDLYRNREKNLLTLKAALINMVKVLAEMNNVNPDSLEIKIDFDDSLFNDKDSERSRMLVLVNAGRYPLWRYLVNYENYTEGEAKEIDSEYVPEGTEPKPTIESGFGTPTGGADIADTKENVQEAVGVTLNGAQVASLIGVVKSVKAGEISRSAAIALIMSSFGMTEEQANALLAEDVV